MIPILFLGILLAIGACGKKRPPFLPQKKFSVKVADLKGEWAEGYFTLKGHIIGLKGPKKADDLIKGSRVYYGEYPLHDPPCDTCPIEYHGYHEFGPEVITEEGFFCRVPGKVRGRLYYFKVHLIGSEGAVGPSSNRVRVTVE